MTAGNLRFDCWVLIAEFYLVDRGLRHRLLISEFYLVDRGLRHRLPGFSSLVASFYLVDRGLWHRLPGISGFGPACCSSVGPP